MIQLFSSTLQIHAPIVVALCLFFSTPCDEPAGSVLFVLKGCAINSIATHFSTKWFVVVIRSCEFIRVRITDITGKLFVLKIFESWDGI